LPSAKTICQGTNYRLWDQRLCIRYTQANLYLMFNH